MRQLLFAFGLLLSAQAASAGVIYSFATVPVGTLAPFTFSFEEPTYLTQTTTIPDSDLTNVSGLLPGFSLDSIVISYVGHLVTVTENLNKGLPISFFFYDGPWTAPGTYDSLLDAANMTITDAGAAVPEPEGFGLAILGGALITSLLYRGANNFRKCRS